jgi:hypothetical protein
MAFLNITVERRYKKGSKSTRPHDSRLRLNLRDSRFEIGEKHVYIMEKYVMVRSW